MQIKASVFLAVLSLVCGCESHDRDASAVEPNDLGITEIEVHHDQLRDERLLTVRGLDQGGATIATAVLRTGMVLYGADMAEQLSPGTELKLNVLDTTASFVSPDRVPHVIYQPLSEEASTFVTLRAVASEIDKEAGIRFAPQQSQDTTGELAFTAQNCTPSRFPKNIGGATQCCEDTSNTYHRNAAGAVVNRFTYAPAWPSMPVCRKSDGTTGCTGTGCLYGPCGSAIGTIAGTNGKIFHPTSNPNVCGWDTGGGSFSPEAYVAQTLYGSVTPTCGCTGCNTDGTAQCAFFDDFNRTSGMGSSWLVSGGGGYNTDGAYAVSTAWADNYARALPNPALNTTDYSVTAKITSPSGASPVTGVFARYDGANLYGAAMSVTDGYVTLRRQNGATWSWLAQTSGQVIAGQEHTLKLVVTGTNPVRCQVWLDGVLKIFYEDSSGSRLTGIGAGGIHAQSPNVKYNDINIDPITTPLSAPPTLPLVDDFNRTGTSLTVSPNPPGSISGGWITSEGPITTDGAYAVAGTSPSDDHWAKPVVTLGTNDYSVQADIQVPNSSAKGQVFARASTPENVNPHNYSARLSTSGVSLVRYDNWVQNTLASYNTTLSTGTDYTVKLVATGTNPVHLEVWLNGTLRISYDDSSANRKTSGDVGISSGTTSSTGIKWNSFRVDPITAPWSLVQVADDTGTTLSMSSSGAGHLIVVAVETSLSGTVSSISDNAGNTYTYAMRAVSTSIGRGVELWYAKNSNAGATTVTINASPVHASVAWEVASINTTSPLQTATKLDNQSSSSTPLGASITTSASGEFVVSVAIVNGMISGIHSGNAFTNDSPIFNDGWAHLTSNNAAAGTYQAQWDQPGGGTYCSATAAFFRAP